MSWFKQIKILYSSALNIIYFLLGNIAMNVMLDYNLPYSILIVTILSMVITLVLLNKNYNKKLIISIIVVVTLVIMKVLYSKYYLFLSLYFIIVYFINLQKIDESITYSEAKRNLINILFITFLLTIIVSIMLYKNILGYSFKAYIFYLALMVVVFREILRYDNNIYNPKSKYVNISIVTGVLLLSLDVVLNYLNIIVDGIWHIIQHIVVKILIFITNIIGYPLNAISEFLKSKFMNSEILEKTIFSQRKNNKIKYMEVLIEDNSEVSIIVKMIILVILIFIVYKIVNKYHIKKNIDKKNYIEYEEKLNKYDDFKRKKFKNLKSMFRKKGNIKEEILYKYKKYQGLTNRVGIFRKYMTPTQLKNIVKLKVEDINGLDEFTNIYNEAKFSNHELSNDKLDKVKKDYDNIKNQFKK